MESLNSARGPSNVWYESMNWAYPLVCYAPLTSLLDSSLLTIFILQSNSLTSNCRRPDYSTFWWNYQQKGAHWPSSSQAQPRVQVQWDLFDDIHTSPLTLSTAIKNISICFSSQSSRFSRGAEFCLNHGPYYWRRHGGGLELPSSGFQPGWSHTRVTGLPG